MRVHAGLFHPCMVYYDRGAQRRCSAERQPGEHRACAPRVFAVPGVSFFQDRLRIVFYGLVGLYAASFVAFTWTYFTKYPAQVAPKFASSFTEAIVAASQDPHAKLCITSRIELPYIFVLFANKEDPREFLRTARYSNPGVIPTCVVVRRYTFGLPPQDRQDIDVYVICDGEVRFSRAEFEAEKVGYSVVLRKRKWMQPPTEVTNLDTVGIATRSRIVGMFHSQIQGNR